MDIPTLADAYLPSLVVTLALASMAVLQSGLTAPLAFLKEEQIPGMPLRHDHASLSFRAQRAYSNAVENLPAFLGALVVAMLLGASPGVVNWAAVAFFVFRAAYAVIYYAGIGAVAGGPRTMAYVGGMAANLVILGAAVTALF